jgi:hypothetical protein
MLPSSTRPSRRRAAHSEAISTVTFVHILFGVGIARSWELPGPEDGGPLDLLARRLGARGPTGAAPARAGPGPGRGVTQTGSRVRLMPG